MTSEQLRAHIEREIADYEYPVGSTLGVAWTPDRVAAELERLRAALVVPFETRIAVDGGGDVMGWVVAEAEGYTVFYAPEAESFCLAVGPRDELTSLHVDGDLVGVFMAR